MKKILLILLIHYCFSLQLFSQTVDSTRVVVNIDKKEYYEKEKVIIEIINKSKDTLYAYNLTSANILLYYFDNGDWIIKDFQKLHNGEIALTNFDPNTKMIFIWDQTVWKQNQKDTMVPAKAGKYRIQFKYWLPSDIKYNGYHLSNVNDKPYYLITPMDFKIK
ncbi:MAG: hypothetical protein HGB12_04760 [Bacteroidetes bacterium]|nr:hypothetical protein [Bacteroidota bacterium]